MRNRSGNRSFIEPRRDKHAIAAARRRGLHLKVAIEVIQRSQDGAEPAGSGPINWEESVATCA